MTHKAVIIDETCFGISLARKDFSHFKSLVENYDSDTKLPEEITSKVIKLNNDEVFPLDALSLMVSSGYFEITEKHKTETSKYGASIFNAHLRPLS